MQTHLPPRVAAKPKGPLVFLDYDKDELDIADDQAPWARNAGEVAKRNAQKSAAALARLGPPRRVAYGSPDIEKLDIYMPSSISLPLDLDCAIRYLFVSRTIAQLPALKISELKFERQCKSKSSQHKLSKPRTSIAFSIMSRRGE